MVESDRQGWWCEGRRMGGRERERDRVGRTRRWEMRRDSMRGKQRDELNVEVGETKRNGKGKMKKDRERERGEKGER